jgi:hypothetical protein
MIKGFCRTLTLALTLLCSLNTQGEDVRLPFDETKLEFSAPPQEQARWLLRPVAEYGVLGKPLTALPSPLENLIGKPMTVDRAQLQSYLTSHKITDAEIGGTITNTLKAKYFVIHDVSAPNYREKSFPTNINEATWFYNSLTFWGSNHAAHFFVNRLGQSVAPHPLTAPWRATKFETKVLKEKSRGLFVHTELVQPRRTDPTGRPGNDGIAPNPGFTDPQLDRLALLYVVASMQHGSWMIPAFHANVDAGIPDAHDDPQNFDLPLWSKRLNQLLQALESGDAQKTNLSVQPVAEKGK